MRLTTHGVVERVAYRHGLRGVNRMPAIVQRWYHDALLRRIEKLAGQKVDVVWSFDTSRFLRFSKNDRLFIMHPVDLAVAVLGSSGVRKADLVLTVSEELRKAILAVAPKAHVINMGHGIDVRWLEGHRIDTRKERPRVCISGNMAIRFLDWEVLANEVIANPTVNFHFIGPCSPEPSDVHYQSIRACRNVTFTGLLGAERMMEELHSADVLLLCYRADLWPKELSNSHKILEYLATGKPIVASNTGTYGHAPEGLLYMANDRWEHPALLRKILNDLPGYDTPTLRTLRKEHAAAHTVERLLERVERSLGR